MGTFYIVGLTKTWVYRDSSVKKIEGFDFFGKWRERKGIRGRHPGGLALLLKKGKEGNSPV